MALIDNVQLTRAQMAPALSTYTALPGVPIDWDVIIGVALKAGKEALAREVWNWLDEHPNETIFRVKVDTKVWFVPIKLTWAIKAKDAHPFVRFILGDRPR